MVTRSGRRRPTIEDVAAEAGVSRGTVSRVLNGGHWVSADKLQAVNAAIKKTQYRVNPHARGLVTQRSDSVAFLLTERHELLFEDPNFSRLMRGAAEALAERDVSLVLIMAGTPDEQRRAKEFIIGGQIDGVLLVSWHSGARTLINDIHRAGVPVVACGVPLGFERSLGFVAADDEDGARTMTAHLRGLGRTRIATITGPPDTSGGTKRLEGYRQELGDAFDPALVAVGDYAVEGGARAMEELLARAPDIDAVFAANDLMATGAMRVLAEHGRRIPEDVAVGGFDDSPVAAAAHPPLTTMRQPFDRVSSEMVRLLMQVIDGERAGSIVLPTDLVIRDSA